MIWFAIVPTAWVVVSALLGLLIGQCIRSHRGEEAHEGAPASAATAPEGAEVTEDVATVAAGSGDHEIAAEQGQRPYAGVR